MSTTLDLLQAQVLGLPTAERARLLDRLIFSLDADANIEAEWDVVADAREKALDSGTVTAVPAEEAIARLQARCKG